MAMFALAGNEGPPGPAGPEGPPGDSHWKIDGAATCYTAGPVGIGTATPSSSFALDVQGGEIVRRDSTIDQPLLLLLETRENDFARLNFATLGGSRLWAIAARSGGSDPATGLMNFFNPTAGDLLTIRGNGPVGVGTTSPQARLSVASQSQWQPLVGNGRGDLYVGDGDVGLSAGVARMRGLQHGDPAPRQVRVTAAGDLTTAPRPGSMMIPPAAFSPDQDGADYINLGWLTVFAHLGSFVAPVDLPDGATVTRMTVWFVDESDATDLRVRLCADRLTNIESGCIPLADIETSGNGSGIRSLSDDTIEFEPEIDHDRLFHRIIVSPTGSWAGANSALVAVRIDYLEP
ncbi:MAG: hypothetical protein RQ847_04995 [Wenzhouxiangellaceae bacterium]|nr:hypothetical protein [Wenzhouxiangellaceae bacterium]